VVDLEFFENFLLILCGCLFIRRLVAEE